jgi:hypothetical protein
MGEKQKDQKIRKGRKGLLSPSDLPDLSVSLY